MFIAILRYTKPIEEVDRHLQAHRQYLAEHYAAGHFIASGPRIPRVGGVIMMRAENRAAVDAIIAQDPFYIHGIAGYQIVEFTPTMFCDRSLEEIMNGRPDAYPINGDDVVFRKATEKDIPAITSILTAAVERMLAEGKRQWNESYPTECHVRADVTAGNGYILQHGAETLAYGAVMFNGEPAYDRIRGQWLTDVPYVVVHRMAVAPASQCKGCGLSFLQRVEALALSKNVKSFRIDTNHDNDRMLGLLKRAGFSYCGEIEYDAGERMAFEKKLNR